MITKPNNFPKGLYLISIIFYAILLIPSISIWRKHGRPGFLGWHYVYGFIALRITGSALTLASLTSPGLQISASIVNNMAISPLILAALGILHEARRARYLHRNKGLDLVGVVFFHVLVSGAVSLMIVGIITVVEGKATSLDETFIRLGLALLVVAWLGVSVWTILSMRKPTYPNKASIADSTKLLLGSFVALNFIGIRVTYGVLSFLLTNPTFANCLAVKIALSTVPEFLAILAFMVVGFVTKDMWNIITVEEEEKPAHRHSSYEWQSEGVGYAM